ncbi:hypothetical protein RBH26_10385 [Natronolimnohabitans sp. A-GB9]|uniref:hypothetical protein n=1 Tax=Natronolimnohabitans sp. A-GB9 TaxID=3069757 RepID=UPI0027B2A7C2|nr:hypothetical protein [Natronolimnohabitans sp. A-GB9]MDQ2050890.1 hypothetical protein [Natronolimnohabitans sp. A-GB9]
MNRRQYLIRTGAGVATATALAGCLSDLTGSDSNVTVTDRTGDRALARAVGALNEAALTLVVTDDVDEPSDLEFDPAEPTTRIEDGRAHLETAATELDDDREADVDVLRTYADVLERLVAVTDTVADETLADDAEDAFEAVDGDGDLEDASTTVTERTAALERAQSRHDGAREDVDDFDDRFEELVRIDRTRLEDAVAELGDVLSPLVALGDALETLLDGYESLENGQELLEEEKYDAARDEFDAAESSFEAATATLDAIEDPPSDLVDTIQATRCRSTHLATAASAFDDAAAAGADGDTLSVSESRQEANRALEDARNCSQ